MLSTSDDGEGFAELFLLNRDAKEEKKQSRSNYAVKQTRRPFRADNLSLLLSAWPSFASKHSCSCFSLSPENELKFMKQLKKIPANKSHKKLKRILLEMLTWVDRQRGEGIALTTSDLLHIFMYWVTIQLDEFRYLQPTRFYSFKHRRVSHLIAFPVEKLFNGDDAQRRNRKEIRIQIETFSFPYHKNYTVNLGSSEFKTRRSTISKLLTRFNSPEGKRKEEVFNFMSST